MTDLQGNVKQLRGEWTIRFGSWSGKAWKKNIVHPLGKNEFLTGLSPIPPITDEGLTLEMSAFKLFTMANLHYQLSW